MGLMSSVQVLAVLHCLFYRVCNIPVHELPSLLIQFHIVECLFTMSPAAPGDLMAQPMIRGSCGSTLPSGGR